MSQFPPGYPAQYPMPFYAAPTVDALAPARRASVMMIVIGTLSLLMGGCMGITAALLPQMQSMPELNTQLSQLESQSGVSITALLIVAASLFAAVAIVQIVLGFIVRRGSMVPAVISIVFTSLILIYCGINAIAALALQGQFGGACMSFAAAALFVVQLVMLFQVCRNAGQARSMQFMSPAMMPWPGYAGPQQGYGQMGYGYGPITPQQPQQHPTPPPSNP